MNVQDVAQENVEMSDPSTMRGIAIAHFCMARQQGVRYKFCPTSI